MILHYEHIYVEACIRIQGWRGSNGGVHIDAPPITPHRHIAAILGYEGVMQMYENWHDSDTTTLHQLCGPHGYAIYRMLLINRHLLPEEE